LWPEHLTLPNVGLWELGGDAMQEKNQGKAKAGRCKVWGDLECGIGLMWHGKHTCMEHIGWGGMGLGARAHASTVRV